MRRRCATLAVAAAGLAGCGTPGGDLLVVSRTGDVAGARLQMRIVDDGRVVCNGRTHDLSSGQLIAAREITRELGVHARRRTRLPPGDPSLLRFTIRTEQGRVAFSDTSPRQPPVFYRAAQLVRTLARAACGLPR